MDEVFSTMDDARTRRVLGFLKELGLQTVCAAPTRSMAAVLDEFNTRINFSRYHTHRETVAAKAAATFETNEPAVRIVATDFSRTAQSGGS